MRTNDNRSEAANADFAAFDLASIRPPYATPGLAEAVDAIVYDLWRLHGGPQGACRLSGILGRVAWHVRGERLSLADRDQILLALGEAEANLVSAMFDPDGIGHVVDDALRALAVLTVWWQQDRLARATRGPAEVDAMLAQMRLCRLELDGVVRRADRAQRSRRPVAALCRAAG